MRSSLSRALKFVSYNSWDNICVWKCQINHQQSNENFVWQNIYMDSMNNDECLLKRPKIILQSPLENKRERHIRLAVNCKWFQNECWGNLKRKVYRRRLKIITVNGHQKDIGLLHSVCKIKTTKMLDNETTELICQLDSDQCLAKMIGFKEKLSSIQFFCFK